MVPFFPSLYLKRPSPSPQKLNDRPHRKDTISRVCIRRFVFFGRDDLIGSATGSPMMTVKCSVTRKKTVTYDRFRRVVYNKEDVLNCSFS